MINSKLSKKKKCQYCHTYVGILTPIRFIDCCERFICNSCLSYHKCSKSQFASCARCFFRISMVSCDSCSGKQFCRECDQIVHSRGKFCIHKRQQIDLKQQNSKTKLSLVKEEVNIQQLEVELVEKEISQKWSELVEGINAHFKILIEELTDKKDEIVEKLEQKKQIELNKYKATKQTQQSVDQFDLNLKELKRITESTNEIRKYSKPQLNQKLFEEVRKLVSKLGMKNVILKVQDGHQKKNSCVFSSLSSTLGNSGFKSSRNMHSKLSNSTVEGEWKEYQEEINSSIKVQKNSQEKLLKVRSERLLHNRFLKSGDLPKRQDLNTTKLKK